MNLFTRDRWQDCRRGFLADWRFLTIVPLPGAKAPDAPPPLDVRWFPLVGWIVGCGAAAAYLLAHHAGLAPLLCALLALGFLGAVTGLLHEDGLGDVADSMGGRTQEARLAILRDSRIGVYGVASVLFCALLRLLALASLGGESAHLAAAALAASSAFSRAGMGFLAAALDNARSDGLSAALLPRPAPTSLAIATALLLPAILLVGAAELLAALLAMAIALTLLALWAKMHLGGRNGDVLGAAQVLSECAFLLALNLVL